MKINDRAKIFNYVKNTVFNNNKERTFIELNIPCSKTSEEYGWIMFDLTIELIDLGYDCFYVNPAGASSSNNTAVHLFVFSNSEDKKAFQKAALELHKEVDKKVVDMFNSGTSIPYEQLKEDVKDIPLEYECNTKELKI